MEDGKRISEFLNHNPESAFCVLRTDGNEVVGLTSENIADFFRAYCREAHQETLKQSFHEDMTRKSLFSISMNLNAKDVDDVKISEWVSSMLTCVETYCSLNNKYIIVLISDIMTRKRITYYFLGFIINYENTIKMTKCISDFFEDAFSGEQVWASIFETPKDKRCLFGSQDKRYKQTFFNIYNGEDVVDINTLNTANMIKFQLFDVPLDLRVDFNKYYLPILLSNIWCVGEPFSVLDKKFEEDEEEETEEIIYSEEQIELMKLLDMLKIETITKHSVIIASAIKNTILGSADQVCYEIFKKYLDKTDFSQERKEAIFKNQETKYTKRTIALFAEKDNKMKYKEWYKGWLKVAIEKMHDSPSDFTVSQVFYRCCWQKYFYSDKSWFQFNGVSSPRIDEDVVKVPIHNSIEKVYKEFIAEKTKNPAALSSIEFKQIKTKEAKVMSFIGSASNINKTLKFAAGLFHTDDTKTVKNPMLTAWANGVIEIKDDEDGHRAIFRDGLLEDYIKYASNVPLNLNYRFESPIVQELLLWLKQLFMTDDQILFMRQFFASLLRGDNNQKQFYIWYGKNGFNGKTNLCYLLKQVLGNLHQAIPLADLFDNKMQSGPTPSKVALVGAHLAEASEPPPKFALKSDAIKQQSCGDYYYARACHSNGGMFRQTHKTVIHTNFIPHIEGIDNATIERVVIVVFMSRWLPSGFPATEEEQWRERTFPADVNFREKKLGSFVEPMLWLMFNDYKLFVENKLSIPASMKEVFEEHLNKINDYRRFCKTMLLKTDGIKIKVIDMFERFKTWIMKDPTATIKKMDTDKQFVIEISKIIGEPNPFNEWVGFQMLAIH